MRTIREIRLQQHLSQATLAVRAGISCPVISRAENGKPIDRKNFILICEALGVEPADVGGATIYDPLAAMHQKTDARVGG